MGENTDRVARIQQSIPGMVHPAVFRIGKIQKAIKLFVKYFDPALDQGRRVYPRGNGLSVMRSLEEFFKAQGFSGGGSRAFIDFLKLVGIIFIAVLLMNGVQVSLLREIPAHRMLGQYSHTECVGKPCI